ncbi:glutathione S-transferase 1-like [Teleopsis dalmanni]|uniref:glutathione S-transferase 1-like n=1 Tax=Teleopsis dalmanni TaxID=139649 RepID=UPI0018CE05A4|nr:glutathione S-transferase 1-like [Teleopsis dalmanni]XP_037952366.1 glutathione S-transferase 1-like [Teleopsis dalmanni]
MSNIVLYGTDLSPPVRACLLTLKALDLPFEYKIVDLKSGEHYGEEFTKRNPQHTVPLLNDGDAWIWDSHAICAYLVDKYGKDDSLYPKDLLKRAVVNQRMFFEASILFMSLRNASRPMWLNKHTVLLKEKLDNIKEGYGVMEDFLKGNNYATGNTLTIADFSCVSTLSTLRAFIDIDANKYPNMHAWLQRVSQLPYYEEANGKGSSQYEAFIKHAMSNTLW